MKSVPMLLAALSLFAAGTSLATAEEKAPACACDDKCVCKTTPCPCPRPTPNFPTNEKIP